MIVVGALFSNSNVCWFTGLSCAEAGQHFLLLAFYLWKLWAHTQWLHSWMSTAYITLPISATNSCSSGLDEIILLGMQILWDCSSTRIRENPISWSVDRHNGLNQNGTFASPWCSVEGSHRWLMLAIWHWVSLPTIWRLCAHKGSGACLVCKWCVYNNVGSAPSFELCRDMLCLRYLTWKDFGVPILWDHSCT